MRSHSFIGLLAILAPATTFAASIQLKRAVAPASGSSLPSGWAYSGCYVDTVNPRSLSQAYLHDDTGLTAATCIAFCSAKGYTVAGTEYSSECYCGSSLPPTTGAASTCNMACSGDSTQACGGPARLSVYQATAPAAITTNPGVDGWTSLGCVSDSQTSRTLPNFTPVAGLVTVAKCVAACQAAGYSYAGLEYSSECWCGSNPSTSALTDQTGCNMPCAGNFSEYCGGPDRLNVYGAVTPGCRPTRFGGYGLIQNGGFEGSFTGYTPAFLSGSFAVGLDTLHEYEGCYAAYAYPTSSPTDGVRKLEISQVISGLVPGQKYLFTGFQGRVAESLNYPSPTIDVSIGNEYLGQIVACSGTSGCEIPGPNGSRYTEHIVPFTYTDTATTAAINFIVTWTSDDPATGNPELLFDGFRLVQQ